jgi:nucleoid-associated protein EbfC
VSSGADEHLPARTGGDPADIPDLGDPGGPAGFGALAGFGGGDLSALMAQAQQMQQQLIEAQDELANAEVTGTAGGGLVTATVTGTGEVIGLVIDPSAIDPADPEGLADVVLAAIRDATRAAADLQAQAMGPVAQGLGGLGGGPGLGIPGL